LTTKKKRVVAKANHTRKNLTPEGLTLLGHRIVFPFHFQSHGIQKTIIFFTNSNMQQYQPSIKDQRSVTAMAEG